MNPIQTKLDIAERSRTSLLPWRGQFSPELIEHLIETFCPDAAVIADPFCGSGTVIAEAMRSGRAAVGIDINPAAYVLSSFSRLLALQPQARSALAADAARLMSPHLSVEADMLGGGGAGDQSIADIVASADDPNLRLLLHIGALVGCGDSKDLSSWKLARGAQSTLRTLSKFDVSSDLVDVVFGDARAELGRFNCDAIITSPPYINVFNYHQNYRPVMEHLGWSPLSCAVGEIGSNRKHRQNRFLTVIQYCMDMALLLGASASSLPQNGVLLMVVGRESNVLKTAFYNSELITGVVERLGFLTLVGQHERVFTNRFGARIYEDILVLRPSGERLLDETTIVGEARTVGISALAAARMRAPQASRSLIESAIEGGQGVRPSAHPALTKSALWPIP